MFDETDIQPLVMVSTKYSSIFDGISYAEPWPVNLDWWKGTSAAKSLALRASYDVIVPQFWNDPPEDKRTRIGNGNIVLQAHGHIWEVEGESADFGTAMWNRLGFTRAQMIAEPLVVDRRDRLREDELVRQNIHGHHPLLLYNFTGICSPFPYVPEVLHVISKYRSRFELVDLGVIRAYRIYDLLGLYDRAVGLITIDTATAHLAPGSAVPTLWFTVDSTGASVPRGNVALHVKYSETPKRLAEIENLLDKWLEC